MITLICGDPGTGKTALMTKFAVERMTGAAARTSLADCRRVVKRLNSTGFRLTPPSRHLVFADYAITARRNRFRRAASYDVNGYFIGLPNGTHPTVFLPPYSLVCLDEAQRYYNSRESARLADFVSRFYETHRHYDLDFIMACQRPGLIDLNIRAIAERFIFITALKARSGAFNRAGRVEWDCIEFDNCDGAEAYSRAKKPDGAFKRTKYCFEGDIWACYDCKGMFPLHLNGRYASDFEAAYSAPPGYDMARIAEFNDVHNFEVPETFYKQNKRG